MTIYITGNLKFLLNYSLNYIFLTLILTSRLKGLGYKVERPPLKIGRYKMMKHEKRKPQLWSKR